MYTLNDFIEDGSIWVINDILVEILYPEPLSESETDVDSLVELFMKLPEHIQNEAYSWGMNDTVFKDNAYVYFRNL